MLAAILHDVKAYDPRYQGLNHLVIHGDTLFPDRQPFTGEIRRSRLYGTIGSTSGGGARKLFLSHPIAQASLTDILSTKVRTLWCGQKVYTKTRVCGPTRFHQPFMTTQWMETLPLLPPMSTLSIPYLNFEWFESDPRPVEPDTCRMPFVRDPRRCHHSWKAIEEALGVRYTTPFRVYVCVASELALAELWGGRSQPTEKELGLHQLDMTNRRNEQEEWTTIIDYWVNFMNENPTAGRGKLDESCFRGEEYDGGQRSHDGNWHVVVSRGGVWASEQ
ncbi:hypothetical protein BPOR_0770g00010 [Botrytis porri]|uniref:Uncharacterized protein n=2 Tax=Botrytis porri TaxID=87229 RepID=A0A4Z1KEU8_9HELO|nr:hypothetical protein BPOR_0770g00010 [Botrytis porri]